MATLGSNTVEITFDATTIRLRCGVPERGVRREPSVGGALQPGSPPPRLCLCGCCAAAQRGAGGAGGWRLLVLFAQQSVRVGGVGRSGGGAGVQFAVWEASPKRPAQLLSFPAVLLCLRSCSGGLHGWLDSLPDIQLPGLQQVLGLPKRVSLLPPSPSHPACSMCGAEVCRPPARQPLSRAALSRPLSFPPNLSPQGPLRP